MVKSELYNNVGPRLWSVRIEDITSQFQTLDLST